MDRCGRRVNSKKRGKGTRGREEKDEVREDSVMRARSTITWDVGKKGVKGGAERLKKGGGGFRGGSDKKTKEEGKKEKDEVEGVRSASRKISVEKMEEGSNEKKMGNVEKEKWRGEGGEEETGFVKLKER
ncbi:hypothetical protein Tco_0291384 [Tanacetum coccineum]